MTADFDRRVEELASRQQGVFSVQQVLLLQGNPAMIEHRVKSGRWRRSGRGVLRLGGTPDTFETQVIAVILGLRCVAFASHRCATRIYGLPGFAAVPEVTAADGGFVRRSKLRQHRTNLLPAHHRRVIRGIPITSIARTLFDLTGVIRAERVERALDTALARGMVTLPALAAVTNELSVPGRRKLTVMRKLLTARGTGFVPPASELEAQFIRLVQRFGLAPPERQVDLGSTDEWIGRVDFLYRSARIVIEVDGVEHHSSHLDRRADTRRQEQLTQAGWKVYRFGWKAVVDDPTMVAATLRSALDRAA